MPSRTSAYDFPTSVSASARWSEAAKHAIAHDQAIVPVEQRDASCVASTALRKRSQQREPRFVATAFADVADRSRYRDAFTIALRAQAHLDRDLDTVLRRP